MREAGFKTYTIAIHQEAKSFCFISFQLLCYPCFIVFGYAEGYTFTVISIMYRIVFQLARVHMNNNKAATMSPKHPVLNLMFMMSNLVQFFESLPSEDLM